jgi:hypothetical protein
MDAIWAFLITVLCVGAAVLPMRYLRPKGRRVYFIVLVYAIALLLAAMVAASFVDFPAAPLLMAFCVLMALTNATYFLTQTRVCQTCGDFIGLRHGAKELHACNPNDLLVEADAAELAQAAAAGPPAGFNVTTAANGDLRVTYRTTGMGVFALLLCGTIIVLTCGFAYAAYDRVVLQQERFSGEHAIGLLCIQIFAGFIAWYLLAESTFTLSNEAFTAERRLGPIHRRRVFARDEQKLIKIVKDGGEDSGSFQTWALVVTGALEICILAQQRRDKILWLGDLLAKWSGLTLQDGAGRVYPLFRPL